MAIPPTPPGMSVLSLHLRCEHVARLEPPRRNAQRQLNGRHAAQSDEHVRDPLGGDIVVPAQCDPMSSSSSSSSSNSRSRVVVVVEAAVTIIKIIVIITVIIIVVVIIIIIKP